MEITDSTIRELATLVKDRQECSVTALSLQNRSEQDPHSMSAGDYSLWENLQGSIRRLDGLIVKWALNNDNALQAFYQQHSESEVSE